MWENSIRNSFNARGFCDVKLALTRASLMLVLILFAFNIRYCVAEQADGKKIINQNFFFIIN